MSSKVQEPGQPAGREPAALPVQELRRAIEGLRHGVVQLVIQDGRVVQIDRTEKIRLV